MDTAPDAPADSTLDEQRPNDELGSESLQENSNGNKSAVIRRLIRNLGAGALQNYG